MNVLPPNMRFGARQSVERREDLRLITGQGRYLDDKNQPDAQWLVLLRSPQAHARIASLDTEAAKGMPGVVAVYTGADLVKEDVGTIPTPLLFKRPDGSPMSVPPRRLLAHEVVRYVGDPVAAVVARSRVEAYDAAEAIAVDYDPLPAVSDVREAVKPGAPKIWDDAPDNIVAGMAYGDKAKVDEALAKAAHVVSLDLVNQRLVPTAIEPRACFAEVDENGRLTLNTQSQTPAGTRDQLAEAVLKRPKDSVRVLVGDIGGGFGHKTGLYPEEALVAYAALKTGQRTQWRGERIDDFLGGTHGRDLAVHGELAFDSDGRILAFRMQSLGNTGGYVSGTGAIIPLVLGPFVSTCIYDIPLIHWEMKAVLTNTAPIGAYRGAGRPEAIYTMERLMDAAARQIGMDPREIRRRNAVPADRFPYANSVGQVYDSGAFAELLAKAGGLTDEAGFIQRKREAEGKGQLYGRGVASYIEWTGGNVLQDTATLYATADGRLVLHSATQAMGQGLETAYSQMIAAAFDVPIERVTVVQGDTDLGQGMGSVGSRSMFVGGSAVAVSASDLMDKAREKAAEKLESAAQDLEYRSGAFTIAGTDRTVGLFDLASGEEGGRLAVTSTAQVDAPSWPNGVHVAEVAVDPETGHVQVTRYATIDDVGVPINPMLVRGQIHGGITQGLGQALFEGARYDSDGQLLTSSLMDYQLPRADDLPFYDVTLFDGAPCRTNPLGAKGCGESGTVGATPTVVNAVIDALSRFGVKHLDMPLTPEKVWRAIHAPA